MNSPTIDFEPLRHTQATLAEALQFWLAEAPASPLRRHLRSAVIQSFAFVYELSIRLLRRALVERAASTERIVDLSFNDLLRVGADAGLIDDPTRWRAWREMRNVTSHAYDEAKAETVALRVDDFLADAERLLKTLEADVAR